ncbi:MAG: DUF2070 family protein [Candidatus Lokiarchaeota archaeon]|nr:DUF2070 family protein [Candidatus Lokiarchaeota archaeon]MBD3202519.1 DUF2070 family protein [Candidatus Lokiarchaeota archaeon]
MENRNQPSRKVPFFFSFLNLLTNKMFIYFSFFFIPIMIALVSSLLNQIYFNILSISVAIYIFLEIFIIFISSTLLGSIAALLFSYKAPILKKPPNGWAIQFNTIITFIIGITYLIGHIISIVLRNLTFREVFIMLGVILGYIVAFVIYFSFTTVKWIGYLTLSLIQPITVIILYSFFTAQFSLDFFIKSIIFFASCAFIFAIPYSKGLLRVSNIYKEATGLGGYKFIRAFVLSMITQGNDQMIENLFDDIGVLAEIRIQYLLIRSSLDKKLLGIFIIPNVHFGPFKTCGSSDLPEYIYKSFENIPGITVFHTTTDHTENLTSQKEVDKITAKIQKDLKILQNAEEQNWIEFISEFKRIKLNSAKVYGFKVEKTPLLFLTRHPLPSDDIESTIGHKINEYTKSLGFTDPIIIDSHNSILGDEVLIKENSEEAKELFEGTKKILNKFNRTEEQDKGKILYGVAKDRFINYKKKDGIGNGGMTLHLFMNELTGEKNAILHFDANNAFPDIRNQVLNFLSKKGIKDAELTTSDSHSVAVQFTKRGYSPLGERIKIDIILKKLEKLLHTAEKNLLLSEFLYDSSTLKDIKIWGDHKYFNVIMNTLKEAVRVSQKLLSLSLIVPTIFSLILLLFYYNIQFTDIIP